MTVIAHISDLHFGALHEATLAPLRDAVASLNADLVVVSGDLTQRARREQFQHARAFLDQLPCRHLLVVPGNHDVPLFNPVRRFVRPLRDFRKIIEADPFPTFVNQNVAIIGINTARSATIADGRVNGRQLRRISEFVHGQPDDRLRIVVAHHPFALPEGVDERRVGRARRGLAALVDSRVDLLLTGHRHRPWVRMLEPGLITVHAGTATSSRTRGDPNSFHELVLEQDWTRIRRWDWRTAAECFEPLPEDRMQIFDRVPRRPPAPDG